MCGSLEVQVPSASNFACIAIVYMYVYYIVYARQFAIVYSNIVAISACGGHASIIWYTCIQRIYMNNLGLTIKHVILDKLMMDGLNEPEFVFSCSKSIFHWVWRYWWSFLFILHFIALWLFLDSCVQLLNCM